MEKDIRFLKKIANKTNKRGYKKYGLNHSKQEEERLSQNTYCCTYSDHGNPCFRGNG